VDLLEVVEPEHRDCRGLLVLKVYKDFKEGKAYRESKVSLVLEEIQAQLVL
jgi:hypothetical protein